MLNGSLVLCRHFLLCLYGTVAIGFILAGRVKELRVVHILTGTHQTCLRCVNNHIFLNWFRCCYPFWFLIWSFFLFAAVYYGVDKSFRSLAPRVIQASKPN